MARSEPTSQHGWFPDPDDPQRLRMWDGKGWTSLTKYPARDEPVTAGAAPAGPVPHRPRPQPERLASAPSAPSVPTAPTVPSAPSVPSAPTVTSSHRAEASFVAGNLYSLITLGVAIVYIVLASAIGWVFVGILPVLLAIRAFREREPMAPFAGLGAGAAVVIGLVLLAR